MIELDPAAIPSPAATGLLSERPLAHLLAYVIERALSGTIELADDPREYALIAMVGGKVARVWTSEPVSYLGHVLYEGGVIDQAQLGVSLAEIAATKALHGQLLLAKGIIDEAQLANGLRQQRLRKLHHLFELPATARFAFYADVDLVGARPNDVEPVDPLPSMWRGVTSHPSADHVRAMTVAVGLRAVQLTGALDTRTYDEGERVAIESLRQRPATIAELAARPGLDPRLAELIVYFLMITKRAELTEAALPPAPVARPTVTQDPPVSVRAPFAQAGPESVRRISVPESSAFAASGAARLGPRASTPKLSVTFPGPDSADGAPPSSVRNLVASAPPSSVRGGPPSSRMIAPPSSRVMPVPLPVPSRAQYDAPPSSLRGIAQSTPNPPASTAARPVPAAQPTRSPEADSAIAQAEMHFVLEERQEAVSYVRQALTHSPKMPAALALLSAIEASSLKHGEEHKLRDILKRLDAIIAADDTCRRGLYYRAQIKKRLGDFDGAIQDLRRAVANDPDDADVQRELRLSERQNREPEPPKSTSFLDRLRGKSGG